MKKEELRIGNFIEQGKVFEVKPYHVRVSYWHQHKQQDAMSLVKLDECNPIPLSEELLLKCGFEKVEVEIEDYYSCSYEKQLSSDVFISYADDFSCTLHWNKKESINGFGVIPNWHSIDTVHGLQNLCYILTGEELEVSL